VICEFRGDGGQSSDPRNAFHWCSLSVLTLQREAPITETLLAASSAAYTVCVWASRIADSRLVPCGSPADEAPRTGPGSTHCRRVGHQDQRAILMVRRMPAVQPGIDGWAWYGDHKAKPGGSARSRFARKKSRAPSTVRSQSYASSFAEISSTPLRSSRLMPLTCAAPGE
jgi:hypothetical protein